ARGYSWTPKNRRPEKLRDSLKELEVMLSSGTLVTLTLNGPQLEHVYIDRTLVGRLPASTVTDAVLSDRLILLSFLEQSQVAAVYLNQKNQDSPETGRRTDKLSPCEIKVVCVDMSGRGRRLHRRVGLNRLQDVALCWWDLDEPGEELWTWTPTDTHRSNLVLLSCSPAEGLKVLSSVRTEGNPLDCRFSVLQPYQLLTVELPAGQRGYGEGSQAEACVYECARERLHRLSVTRIPLPSRPVSCSRHPCESTLLLGLSDSSLVLYDQRRGVSLLASCPCATHPPRLAPCWGLGHGALTGGQLGHEELLQQRLRCGQVRDALGILEAMDWSIMGDECYRGLSSITNHLLRLELNAEREAQLEAALGVFYAPSAALSDVVILEYREPVSKYARRFFHHLLRHKRFEKAFLLAVDLEARDLFMDLHYVASDKGELVLADVAKRKANEIEARADVAGGGKKIIMNVHQTPNVTRYFFLHLKNGRRTLRDNLGNSDTLSQHLTPAVFSGSHPHLTAQRRVESDHV
ncbi:WD repeat-containing and planar cell polarity effector protein fritz-like protein, partial [Nibea albiflora]